GRFDQEQQRDVLLERQPMLGPEVLVEPSRDLCLGANERPPRREARISGRQRGNHRRCLGRHCGAIVRASSLRGQRRPDERRATRLASAAMTTFDVDAIRARFPALSVTHDGRPFVYFDGPGGTQVPQSVIDAVVGYYRSSNANHGGTFLTSERSDAIVNDAHAALADLIGVDADEITLGPNMTTLTFHLSRSIGA